MNRTIKYKNSTRGLKGFKNAIMNIQIDKGFKKFLKILDDFLDLL